MTEEQLAAWERMVRRVRELRPSRVADIERLQRQVALGAFHAGEGIFKVTELRGLREDLEETDAILAMDAMVKALRNG